MALPFVKVTVMQSDGTSLLRSIHGHSLPGLCWRPGHRSSVVATHPQCCYRPARQACVCTDRAAKHSSSGRRPHRSHQMNELSVGGMWWALPMPNAWLTSNGWLAILRWLASFKWLHFTMMLVTHGRLDVWHCRRGENNKFYLSTTWVIYQVTTTSTFTRGPFWGEK